MHIRNNNKKQSIVLQIPLSALTLSAGQQKKYLITIICGDNNAQKVFFLQSNIQKSKTWSLLRPCVWVSSKNEKYIPLNQLSMSSVYPSEVVKIFNFPTPWTTGHSYHMSSSCTYLLQAIVNVAQKRLQKRTLVTHSAHKHVGFHLLAISTKFTIVKACLQQLNWTELQFMWAVVNCYLTSPLSLRKHATLG